MSCELYVVNGERVDNTGDTQIKLAFENRTLDLRKDKFLYTIHGIHTTDNSSSGHFMGPYMNSSPNSCALLALNLHMTYTCAD